MAMTTTLLESKAKPFGSSRGALISMAIHGGLIAAAVALTTQVVLPPREKVEEHPVLYVAAPPPKPIEQPPAPLPKAPTPPKAKAEKVFKAPPAPKKAPTPTPRPTPVAQPKVATPVIQAPTKIALSIPTVDVKAPPVTEVNVNPPSAADIIKGSGIDKGGSVKSSADGDVDGGEGGRKGGLSSGNSGKAYDEDQVDKAVEVSRKVDPRYPDALKSVNVQGMVRVRFIVSADGRVEPGSIEILESSHKLFSDAVKTALLATRYRPAEAGGQRVRQLVEQPFSFKLQ